MITIRDRTIDKDILDILYDVQSRCHNGKLSQITDRGDEIQVTCPSHSGGHESRPSCFIRKEDGIYHCFTCGIKGYITKFVGECFDRNREFGENRLLSNYVSDYVDNQLVLPKIILDSEGTKINYLDESILNKFESYHPYMTKRGLTPEVIQKYEVKYDPETKCIVFPVRDIKGKLRFLTRRSVEGKKFIIDKDADKSIIYNLNNVQYDKMVFVVEAQISCLKMSGWGIPTIALFGAGTSEDQIKTLNNTGIRRFILCYDNDPAGIKGVNRFKKYIDKDRFVDIITLPVGKDPADMTETEFKHLVSLQLGDCIL